jgi:predicted nucleic acid-binding protein
VTIVVDASVAIKWVLEEEGSQTARRLVAEELLIAPDFLIVECANVLWTAVRRGRMSAGDAIEGLAIVRASPAQLIPTADHVDAALELALALGHVVYDVVYLAIALAERATLVTADRPFVERVMRHGLHSHAVRLLGAT